jgi:protein involved in polysaccharide export with SLBB domain
MNGSSRIWLAGVFAALGVAAQDPTALLEAQASKQMAGGTANSVLAAGAEQTPKAPVAVRQEEAGELGRQAAEGERLARDIRAAKAKEKGPKRFASDLFESRQVGGGLTDGGIAEDYVLGVGDRLQLNVFGSATFEVPLAVDGRGSIVIPKVGTVTVAGKTLANARSAVQAKIGQIFSRSTADLSVTKLREVRVFVLGEVYKPGSFLVPNLSSIVNVISLSGGPTAIGSYRQVRVMRGGKIVHSVDFYPLRAEGLGNLNFGFQNGDTVFVPLVQNQVLLQGGFTRVVATVQGNLAEGRDADGKKETEEQRRLKMQIQQVESRLAKGGEAEVKAPLTKDGPPQPVAEATVLTPEERKNQEERLAYLRDALVDLKYKARGDMRVEDEGEAAQRLDELSGQPFWLRRWLQEGTAPVMQFEMLPGESVKDALHFAGGFALKAFSGAVSVRRVSSTGALTVLDVPAGDLAAGTVLEKGDVVTALPQRDPLERAVKVSGWVRVQGTFARKEGQHVGELLKSLSLVLPDTYLERGELVRTQPDGAKQYFAFNLAKAMTGEPSHNLLLEDRDAIELYRIGDLRMPKTLVVLGPVTRPGTFEYIDGMRVSDLIFRAGLPLKNADRFVAELAHTRDGKPGEVRRLDLAKLLSTEGASPVDLRDEATNPKLEAFDQLSIYAKPDYRAHRAIILSGQVNRPGTYELDSAKTTFREVIARAGGLTAEAMPTGGIFLRSLSQLNPDKKRASVLSGLENIEDPTSNGINEVLGRLNETKRNPTTGAIQPNKLLHNLSAGNLNRLVVNLPGMLAGDPTAEVDLQDGDEVIIPRKTNVAYVVGETASPFASFKVYKGMTVKDLIFMAGGPTRNADTWNIRLLKADGRILDSWINGKAVEPGDALVVPQRIKRDSSWQENLAALTPLAILINTFK